MDAGEPPDLPQKKGGFKGKRAKRKFARNLKKGKDQKDSRTWCQYVDALSESRSIPPTSSCQCVTSTAIVPSKAAKRKVLKSDLQSDVEISRKELKEVWTAKNQEEKLRKRTEKCLFSCIDAVKSARQDAREARSAAKAVLTDLKQTSEVLQNERAQHAYEVAKAVEEVKVSNPSPNICLLLLTPFNHIHFLSILSNRLH